MVKGNRALNLGLNPHSNGLIFSKLNKLALEKRFPSINKSNLKINVKNITLIKK